MTQNKNLIRSGIIFSVIIILWPVFMAFSQPEGSIATQFEWILDNITIFNLQFFFAALICPALFYMMVTQLKKMENKNSVRLIIGYSILGIYAALISLSYGSQFLILPKLIQAGKMDYAGLWYFRNPSSYSYYLNQLAYAIWGIGAFVLFAKYISAGVFIRIISILYLFSAALSLVAFTGLLTGNEKINSLTVISGLLLLPVGFLNIFWGLKKSKSD